MYNRIKALPAMFLAMAMVGTIAGCGWIYSGATVVPAESVAKPSPSITATNAELPQATVKAIGNEISLKKETTHFYIYCTDTESSALGTLPEEIENSYQEISSDLDIDIQSKILLYIYPDLQTFHNAVGKPNAPSWYIGEGNYTTISIVSPKLMPLDPLKVVRHEMTHVLCNHIGVLPQWFFQGIAMYEGKETPKFQIELTVRQIVAVDKIPSFTDLSTDYYSYINISGSYEISYKMVEYLVNRFGFANIKAFLRSPRDFSGVFGLTEDEVFDDFKAYLIKEYKG